MLLLQKMKIYIHMFAFIVNMNNLYASNLFNTCSIYCQCTDFKLECNNTDFKSIKISKEINTLKLMRVPVSKLVMDSPLGNLKNLKNLQLNNNNITHIDFDFFTHLNQIEILNLRENEIRYLDETTFNALINLKKLQFKWNYIKKLSHSLFFNLTHLDRIDFSSNQIITPITETNFKDLTELQYLDLSINYIQVIASNSFQHNRYLQYINISHNRIQDISDIFQHLNYLTILDLSNNKITGLDKNAFQQCSGLEKLFLNQNKIQFLHPLIFQSLIQLKELKLNNNEIKYFHLDTFEHNKQIQQLDISNLLLVQLKGKLLQNLAQLIRINIKDNQLLQLIEDDVFLNKPYLKSINLADNMNISKVPISLLSLQTLDELNLENLRIQCNCKSTWFIKFWEKLIVTKHVKIEKSNFRCIGKEEEEEEVIRNLKKLKCDAPEVIYSSPTRYNELKTGAVLDCIVIGNPQPTITWFTPNGITFHDTVFNISNHPKIHDNKMRFQQINTIKVMENGSLYIQHVMREDVGNYTCFVSNTISNTSTVITVRLDPITFERIQYFSLAVGLFCAAAFLAATILIKTSIRINKKLWRKRRKQEGSPKSNIHQMIETVEQYRAQQLEKLRENYTQQVKKIKDNCAQQTEWIWESYHGQVKNFKDIKDYGASHLTSIKEQYYDQVKKVRDYTVLQLSKVRENYVFQRDKIRKFSAHQVLRFRENCKYQQQAFNKVVENLPNFNIENCKNGLSQSLSEVNFDLDKDQSMHRINVPLTISQSLTQINLHHDKNEMNNHDMTNEKHNYCYENDSQNMESTKCRKNINNPEIGSSLSLYFTPTDTTNSPMSPRYPAQKTHLTCEAHELLLTPQTPKPNLSIQLKNEKIPAVHSPHKCASVIISHSDQQFENDQHSTQTSEHAIIQVHFKPDEKQ